MNRIRIIVGGSFLLVIVAGAIYYALNRGFISIPIEEQGSVVSGEGLILYRDNGFSPNFLLVKKGTKITFVNSSSGAMWPASDLHPAHVLYPGSSIDKCGTEEEPRIFDSCRDVAPISPWTFTFHEIGVWVYHNHLSPKHLGTIQVVE